MLSFGLTIEILISWFRGRLLVEVSVRPADALPVVEGAGVAVVVPPVLVPVALLASFTRYLKLVHVRVANQDCYGSCFKFRNIN